MLWWRRPVRPAAPSPREISLSDRPRDVLLSVPRDDGLDVRLQVPRDGPRHPHPVDGDESVDGLEPAGEFVYDHPFLWGSKRTGPDLHRIGGKYPNLWHYLHMENPTSMSPNSLMPHYPWLLSNDLDITSTEAKINTMRNLGVPYPDGYEKIANDDLMIQAEQIAADLQQNGAPAEPNKEIIALIAYLQRLGTDIKANPVAAGEEGR